MNFSQGHSGTKVRCESRLFFPRTNTRNHKMGEIHELFVLAPSLVWFAGATPDGFLWIFPRNVIRIRVNFRNSLYNAPAKKASNSFRGFQKRSLRCCSLEFPSRSFFAFGIEKEHAKELRHETPFPKRLLGVAIPPEPRGEKRAIFVLILGGENLLEKRRSEKFERRERGLKCLGHVSARFSDPFSRFSHNWLYRLKNCSGAVSFCRRAALTPSECSSAFRKGE